MLAKFDQPLVFVLAIVLVVTAGQKLGAYLGGKLHQPTIHNFFSR